jgi:hypothetical protein
MSRRWGFSAPERIADRLALVTPKVKREAYFQTIVENALGGTHRHIPGSGFTDVTLANAHVEIKEASKYHQTPGQLLKYHLIEPRPYLVVILFGRLPVSEEFLRRYFAETHVTHVLRFDDADNLVPLFCATGKTSPYFSR